jgi:hypothetical protein
MVSGPIWAIVPQVRVIHNEEALAISFDGIASGHYKGSWV